jgi:hypothetical protein
MSHLTPFPHPYFPTLTLALKAMRVLHGLRVNGRTVTLKCDHKTTEALAVFEAAQQPITHPDTASQLDQLRQEVCVCVCVWVGVCVCVCPCAQ